MSDLYITPTRLRLLRQVALGDVYRVSAGHSVVKMPTGKSWSVTARITELESAGLVEPPDAGRRWRLTPTGQAVINERGIGVTAR